MSNKSRTGKASRAIMESLHGTLARELTNVIKNGVEVVTEDGEVVLRRPPAAMLNVARQFLKDNKIEAGIGNADMHDLERAMAEMSDLPFDGDIPPEYKN